ncbi:2'-5' RNA ligase family protein [Algiphilus sp.]|uniref:2'-5' RNA ligase family protein n=1 Tax=Algiphilus sp. TaxID=1872431 RepID=UPI002A643EA6|nr:2'-5' RNA ligase family protein [Pseudomonadota bacterium]
MTASALPAARLGSAFASGCSLPPLSGAQRMAWHRGRTRYAVWMIEADTAPVRALCAQAHRHLSRWLAPLAARQPHITLAAAGFPVRRAKRSDEFDMSQCRRHRAQLQVAAPAAATVTLAGIGSFNGCAFLRVHDYHGLLQQLHRLLCATIPAAQGQHFVPHITLAPYRGVYPLRDIAEAAHAWSGHLDMPVRRVTLAVFDPRAQEGRLRPVLRIPLREADPV